jgi:hypothetical protein
LTRAVVSAEGVQAVVTPSTEPGIVEVFAFSEGNLISHQGFDAGDDAGLKRFAAEALADSEDAVSGGPDEARVVAAYLKRRSAAVEAMRLRSAEDLLQAVERVIGTGDKTNVASLT